MPDFNLKRSNSKDHTNRFWENYPLITLSIVKQTPKSSNSSILQHSVLTFWHTTV